MYNRKTGIRNIVCVIFCILAAGGLAFIFYKNNVQEKNQKAVLEALQEEVYPYERELRDLRLEMDNLEKMASGFSEETEVMTGFVVSDASDISYISDKASVYPLSPVLILDCTLELDVIQNILETAEESWEIMLYASDFSEETNENVLSVLSYLESVGREHTDIFFLRSVSRTDSNIQLLRDDGFIGYTIYHRKSPLEGQTREGEVYFDYSYLRSTGTPVFSRIDALYKNKTAMLVVFDMPSINEGTLTDDYVSDLLGTIQGYTENGDCTFSTVASVVDELTGTGYAEFGTRYAYQKQAAEVRGQIDELEEIIDGIYDNLEY